MSAGETYQHLLIAVQPRVNHDEETHRHALAEVERLSAVQWKRPDTAVEDMIELLSTLVAKYEAESVRIPDATPIQILTHLMEARDMNQQQFAQEVDLSAPDVSNILSGARPITVDQARKFGECFSVAPSLFLGID